MSEKKGNLIKLTYDFNSGLCCEVSFDGKQWARVTARGFRSFNGNSVNVVEDEQTIS